MKKIKVGILVGSLRKDSYSLAIAKYIKAHSPENMDMEIISIADLPLYNQDYDSDSPEAYTTFREEIKNSDAYLFVTPEHNRSIPACLKNALDVASRPWGQNVWSGKPGAIISQSPGNIGGFGAYHHLRQTLSFLDVYTMNQPECYVSNSSNDIDEKSVVSEHLGSFLSKFISSFDQWISNFVK